MELLELNTKIDEWAVKNGLEKLDPNDQTLKIIEEIGELAEAMLKSDGVAQIDAIGDIYIAFRVLMIQIDGTFDATKIYRYRVVEKVPQKNYAIFKLIDSLKEGSDRIFEALQNVAQYLELDFVACVDLAYNEVKKRELKIVDGVAVKQEETEFIVLDIEENEHTECETYEEVEKWVKQLIEGICDCWEDGIEYREHIKVYELIETISFAEDVEATKNRNEELERRNKPNFDTPHYESIGKWQRKKIGGNK